LDIAQDIASPEIPFPVRVIPHINDVTVEGDDMEPVYANALDLENGNSVAISDTQRDFDVVLSWIQKYFISPAGNYSNTDVQITQPTYGQKDVQQQDGVPAIYNERSCQTSDTEMFDECLDLCDACSDEVFMPEDQNSCPRNSQDTREEFSDQFCRDDSPLNKHLLPQVTSEQNTPTLSPAKSSSDIEEEISSLNHELETIQIECEKIVEEHTRRNPLLTTQASISQSLHSPSSVAQNDHSPRLVPRMGTKLTKSCSSTSCCPISKPNILKTSQTFDSLNIRDICEHTPLQILATDKTPEGARSNTPESTAHRDIWRMSDGELRSLCDPEYLEKMKTSASSPPTTDDDKHQRSFLVDSPLTNQEEQFPENSAHPKINNKSLHREGRQRKERRSNSRKEVRRSISSSFTSDEGQQSQPHNADINHSIDQSHRPAALPSASPVLTHSLSYNSASVHSTASPPHNSSLPRSISHNPTSNHSTSNNPPSSHSISNNPTSSAHAKSEFYSQYADTMYTNCANLEHTMQVQQKLFQQQLCQITDNNNSPSTIHKSTHSTGKNSPTYAPSHQSAIPTSTNQENIYDTLDEACFTAGRTSSSSPSTLQTRTPRRRTDSTETRRNQIPVPDTPTITEPQMEYVVKRRADGSRYVTRRPAKSHTRRNRAKKVTQERHGVTTDDDAQSELKCGKYWNKEEKKRHAEKSKHRKQRHMETVRENAGKAEPNVIVELSQRKMMKQKSKNCFDDFTTLQEMLANGCRGSYAQPYNPLLSVTTV